MADLPKHWTCGVRADGRVFFICDDTRTTTWLHPRTGLPVNSGHMIRSDLPRGWEEGFTCDGASYFIDHNERRTTFTHPQTGLTSDENSAFILKELAPQSRVMSKAPTSSIALESKTNRGSKVHRFGKRQLSIKRNPNVTVERRGWLYKQDGGGMRLWKRKWFVLSDYCLFYYKDSREQSVLGSIPLPSYEVNPVGADDHISRKFAFKAEHSGMRTYFFSAETQDDMSDWITAMNRATRVQNQTRTMDQTRSQAQAQVQTEVPNGVRKVHNGVHCGTNTSSDRRSDALTSLTSLTPMTSLTPLDSSRSSEQTLVHEVQMEPIATATPHLTPPPVDPAPSQSRFNGLDSSPSPILEPNGIAAGTYQTSPAPDTPPGSVYRQTTPTGSSYRLATPTPRQVTPTPRQTTPTSRQVTPTSRQVTPTPTQVMPTSRLDTPIVRQATPPNASIRDQVQNWVKVQKEEHRRSRNSLHRSTPPTQFSPIELPTHQPAPSGRSGEYRYAQDRLSHFGLSDPAVAPPPFWRLYEWQQRHQYRHGNPTAPLYSPAPLRPFGPRPLAAADQPRAPRCVEVPPTLPSAPISRWPHTPAERLTVRPTNDSAGGGAFTGSPRKSQSQFFKTSTLDRRSLPVTSHMTHTVSAPSLHGKTVDESYLQLKKDLEFLDLKTAGDATALKDSKPVRAAESDIDVKLSRLCEQDKSLKELESRISSLTEDKDQVEGMLALCHQQMEHLSDPGAQQKISLQQKLLQEDLIHLRAQLSRGFTALCRSWEQYVLLETSVEQLRSALKHQLDLSSTSQLQCSDLKRELWRIEDVLAGLSEGRAHYSLTIQRLNPERASEHLQTPPPIYQQETPPPPRPPLPSGFEEDEDSAPEVPPLPREAATIRHTSVRGLKRQSDERRRGQGCSDYKFQNSLRSFLSEPQLPLDASCTQLDSTHTGVSGASSGLQQSAISAFVTLRRRAAERDRPKSTSECSASSSTLDSDWLSSGQTRGRMSADEQLRRMSRHCSQVQPITESQSDMGRGQSETVHSEESGRSLGLTEVDMELQEFSVDISKQLSRPEKVQIPERMESDPEDLDQNPEEVHLRRERAARIRNMLHKSGVSLMALVDVSELGAAVLQHKVLRHQELKS